MDMAIFATRLRERRQHAGLTQCALAAKMGIAQSWISELEHGRQTRLEADTVLRFAQALRCSTDYLLGRTTPRGGRGRPSPNRPAQGAGKHEGLPMDTPDLDRLTLRRHTARLDQHAALLADHAAQLAAVQALHAQLTATAARLDATLAALEDLLRRGGNGPTP